MIVKQEGQRAEASVWGTPTVRVWEQEEKPAKPPGKRKEGDKENPGALWARNLGVDLKTGSVQS